MNVINQSVQFEIIRKQKKQKKFCEILFAFGKTFSRPLRDQD